VQNIIQSNECPTFCVCVCVEHFSVRLWGTLPPLPPREPEQQGFVENDGSDDIIKNVHFWKKIEKKVLIRKTEIEEL
jgi:hypothetical protein